jgi:hypothetical protein
LTHFALYTSEDEDNQVEEYDEDEELKKHRELIILLEAVRYCKTNTVDRIRYAKLKKSLRSSCGLQLVSFAIM